MQKTIARTVAKEMVNQAPSGTLSSAEVRYNPSNVANVSESGRTKNHLILQTINATRDTRVVVMTVSRITHTPYALPSFVV